MSSQPDQPDDEHTIVPGVTDAEVEAALGVNSVPDEVRLNAADPDETEQTMDATGQVRGPADRG